MQEYLKSSQEVLKEYDTQSGGLSSAQVSERAAKYGKNKLAEGKKKTLLMRFLEQLADPMIIILIVAAAISGVLAVVEKEFPTDVIIILAVVLINAVLGVFQERRGCKDGSV